jgi:diguanylate cyclase (GGDEF)-like protein
LEWALGNKLVQYRGFQRLASRWLSPFTAPVPKQVRSALLLLQAKRMHVILPFLCLSVAANALAMAIAVFGDLPWWQQFTPPAIIIIGCLAMLVERRARGCPITPKDALRRMQRATVMTAALGLVAGFWCVNAFTETEKYYCMVAPVFIGIGALVCATCMLNAPRAAIVGIITTLSPIIVKMMLYDNLGVRAMAAMLAIIGMMQSGVVLAKFRETVTMMIYQHQLNHSAETDSLTGLDNRYAFMRKLENALETRLPILVALADLDGFKQVNDQYGHQAGDTVLAEVALRMRQLAPRAVSIARLGGDEFVLLFDVTNGPAHAQDVIKAVQATIPLPIVYNTALLSVGVSLGYATALESGNSSTALLAQADQNLYADKAARRIARAAA